MGVFDPIAGFGVTFKTMFRKTFTEEYPNGPKVTAPRFHGRHQLNRWPDGLEKCVGCELCAWACPADAIYVEGAQNTDGERFSPGERYGRVYQINYLRCILCGLCIEACPTRALTMTNEFELADDSRAKLIYEKDDLLGPLLPGMELPPHERRLGDDEQAYFLGLPASGKPDDRAGDISGWTPPVPNQGIPGRKARAKAEKDGRPNKRRRADDARTSGHRGRGRLLDARPGDDPRCARHDPVPQAGALRALPGGGDDLAGGPVRGPGRPVPVRGADHRLHRCDLDAVPVRADAGRGRRGRLAGRDDPRPAGLGRDRRRRLRAAARVRGRQRGRRIPAGPGRRQQRARRQRPGHRGAGLHPVRVRLRGDRCAADHRGARGDGAGPPRAADAEEDAGRAGHRADAEVRRDRSASRTAAQPRRLRPAQRGRHPGPVAGRHRVGAVGVGHPAGARGTVADARELSAPIEHTLREIAGQDGEAARSATPPTHRPGQVAVAGGGTAPGGSDQ